ncbi:MAG: TetR/AcrR family transcriptional regulator [Oscillospiraceae bacterium]
MSNYMPPEKREAMRSAVLRSAALLFLKEGYAKTSLSRISAHSGVQISAINREFQGKGKILCALVDYVIDGQFSTARELMAGIPDGVRYYALDTALQLHITESSPAIKELYITAYQMPEILEHIRRTVVARLVKPCFSPYLPDAADEEFYLLNVVTSGIILSHMSMACSEGFTITDKTRRYLDASLRVYKVPEEKIQEAVAFTQQFDLFAIARQTVQQMITALETVPVSSA